eukprot:6198102-Pleurochrysis_carterae.AAC.2
MARGVGVKIGSLLGASQPLLKLKAAASWKQKHKLKWTEEQIDELPVMIEPYAMFDDIVRRAEEQVGQRTQSTLPKHSLLPHCNPEHLRAARRPSRFPLIASGYDSARCNLHAQATKPGAALEGKSLSGYARALRT